MQTNGFSIKQKFPVALGFHYKGTARRHLGFLQTEICTFRGTYCLCLLCMEITSKLSSAITNFLLKGTIFISDASVITTEKEESESEWLYVCLFVRFLQNVF